MYLDVNREDLDFDDFFFFSFEVVIFGENVCFVLFGCNGFQLFNVISNVGWKSFGAESLFSVD